MILSKAEDQRTDNRFDLRLNLFHPPELFSSPKKITSPKKKNLSSEERFERSRRDSNPRSRP